MDVWRRIWRQHDLPHENGGVTWRDHQHIPPAAPCIRSPDDLDARDARQPSIPWVGDTVHVTDTGDEVTPPWITHVLTTTAPVDDSHTTASMQAARETKGLLPPCHIVATGAIDAERLAVSPRGDAIDPCGAGRSRVRWQAPPEGACALSRLVIDWERPQVTCPAGHTSLSWTPAMDHRDHDGITSTCARGDCRDGQYRAPCARNVRRTLTLRPQEPHEARLTNRKRQSTAELKAEQARRCGIEGTLPYGRRTCGMRRAHEIGLAKTHLQHGARAAVMNLARIVRWLSREPLPQHARPRFSSGNRRRLRGHNGGRAFASRI